MKRANSASAESGSTTSSFILKALVRRAMAPSFLRSAQKRLASAGSLASNSRVLGCGSRMARMVATPRSASPASCPTTSMSSTALGVSARGALTWYPMARTYSSSKCSSAERASRPWLGNGKASESLMMTWEASSMSGPKNSRQRVRCTGYFG